MNKKIQIIFIVFFMVMMLLSIFNSTYAAQSISCSSIEKSAKNFIQEGENQYTQIGNIDDDIAGEVKPVVKILSVAGILIIGICMVILGIQWVLAKPSPETQSKLKHRFVALAVAAGVMFGSYTIWSIIVSIMSQI